MFHRLLQGVGNKIKNLKREKQKRVKKATLKDCSLEILSFNLAC
jgi:hypothetical protein